MHIDCWSCFRKRLYLPFGYVSQLSLFLYSIDSKRKRELFLLTQHLLLDHVI